MFLKRKYFTDQDLIVSLELTLVTLPRPSLLVNATLQDALRKRQAKRKEKVDENSVGISC